MKQIKRLALLLVILLILSVPISVFAAPLPFMVYNVDLVKRFGGASNDVLMDIRPAGSDFILAGYANSPVTDFAPPTTSPYAGGVIMKVNSAGTVVWGKVFEDLGDPTQMHSFWAVEPVAGGYIAVGSKIKASTSDRYALAVKFDLTGNVVWQKTFGVSDNNQFMDICPTADGDVVVAGIGFHYPRADYGGTRNGLVMKLNASTGDTIWQTAIGGTFASTEGTTINAVEPTSDGGYIVSGQTRNNDGDFSGPALGYSQAVAVKLSPTGVREWISMIGGTDDDVFNSIIQLPSGNYMAVGNTRSNDGDFASPTVAAPDAIVAVLNNAGGFIRYFRLTGNSTDNFRRVVPTADGGIAFGWTESTSGDFTGFSHGSGDGLAARITETGGFSWITTFGGTQYDQFNAGLQLSETKVMMVGKTTSTNGDLAGLSNLGGEDLLLAALSITPTDTVGPTLTLTPSTTSPTNTDVVITVTASDPSGVAKITLPNSTVLTGVTNTTYTVSTGGTYTFSAEDNNGFITTQSITITNIDKVAPVITLGTYDGTTPTRTDITVTASTNEGTLNAASHTFTANGSFEFVATDTAGNVTRQTVTITNIDKTPPIITLAPYEGTAPVDGNITVMASTNEGTLNAASHTFTANGAFDFVATDAAGNVTTKTVTITNIHKIPKILSVTGTQKGLASGGIELTVTAQTQWFPVGSQVTFTLQDANHQPLPVPVTGTALVGDDGVARIVFVLPDDFVPGSYFMTAAVAGSNVNSQDNPITILEPDIPVTGEASRVGQNAVIPIALAMLLGAVLLLAKRTRRRFGAM